MLKYRKVSGPEVALYIYIHVNVCAYNISAGHEPTF